MSQNISDKIKKELRRAFNKPAKEICQAAGISQPVFSRNVLQIKSEVLVTGQTRATRYSLRRKLQSIPNEIPIFQIEENSEVIHLATIHLIEPNYSLYVESNSKLIDSNFYSDLPYFLYDLMPSGFLGRLIPARCSDFNLPKDIRLWTSDHGLVYFYNFGWDLQGDLILGDKAYQLFKARQQEILAGSDYSVTKKDRAKAFPKFARTVLEKGEPGSSAGGEQPKFLSVRREGKKLTPILVKFSPDSTSDIAQRTKDLLVCEHLVHKILRQNNISSSQSELIESGQQVFLEMERFHRIGIVGRKGVISLGALDMEFTATKQNWSIAAEALFRLGKISKEISEEIHLLEIFGDLIANSDMHFWNISFYTQGERIGKLTPVYDFLPMLYSSDNQVLLDRKFKAKIPNPRDKPVWLQAKKVAVRFWQEVAESSLISASFREIGEENLNILEGV